MFRPRRLLTIAVLLGATWAHGQTGCQNEIQYPFDPVTPDASGAVDTISTCVYFEEYTRFTGIESGSAYKFEISGNGFITLREGTYNGPVVASANSYLIYTATSTADLFAHYTRNSACLQSQVCQTHTVQKLGTCIPPQAWYTFQGDCEFGDFYVHLDVTSLGTSSSLTVQTDLFGNIETFPNVGTGVLIIGPYYDGEPVTITLVASDPACNIVFPDLMPAAGCPFLLACGQPPVSLNYCYDNNSEVTWAFGGTGTGSLMLDFLSGTIGSSFSDQFVVYDGPDATSPILYQHTGTNDVNDMAGLVLYTTGPNMFIELISDGFGSCVTAEQTEWAWQLACLDCALPQASVEVVENCDTDNYMIMLDVTSTGEGASVTVEYSVDGQTPVSLPGVTTGMTQLGPFLINQVVTIGILHETNALCNIVLGDFTDSGMCPTLVNCGAPQITESYCYTDEDSQFWYYELVGTEGALHLQFTAGSIESAAWDSLTIYDGASTDAPILFQHTGDAAQLSGEYVIATSGSIFMTMSSDLSNSCSSGGQTQWEWFVTCIDCQPAVASYSMIQDCPNSQFFVEVNIAAMGSDPNITITNTVDETEIEVTAPGTVTAGPFPNGTPVVVTLENDDNALCDVSSPSFLNFLCPTMVCGTTPLEETYCYIANDEMEWAYGVALEGQVRLRFLLGTLESATFDVLRIYDGPSDQFPILFEHDTTILSNLGPEGSAIGNPGNFYYEVDVTSTGPNIYMELSSDGSGQCSTSATYDDMIWEVSCVGCLPPGVSYELEPDCEHRMFDVMVEVTETSGPLGFTITEATTGEIYETDQPGSFTFEAFEVDSTATFVLHDLDNPGCIYETLQTYTHDDCVVTSCGIDSYTLCYENDDERWYTYQSEGDYPVSIFFLQGRMMPDDHIVLYNSVNGTSIDSIIYSGNNNGGELLGITANSSNPANALTLLVRSNGQGSCADGGVEYPLMWTVGCGFVGIEEATAASFSLYPNPSNGSLSLDFAVAPETPVTVKVLDMSGRLAHERIINGATTMMLDLSMLQDGQYLLQLTTDKWTATRPFQMMR